MTGVITRRKALALGAGLGVLGSAGSPALAQQRFFRIGTGGTGGTYYPVGGMIANAISTDKINVSAVATNGFELLPIDGAARDKIMAQYKFFAKDTIPDGTYKDVKGVETVAVGAQWTTSSKQPDDLVYEITKALWSDKTRAALDAGHAKGKAIQKETALLGVGIPLHAGAERFYKEAGLLK